MQLCMDCQTLWNPDTLAPANAYHVLNSIVQTTHVGFLKSCLDTLVSLIAYDDLTLKSPMKKVQLTHAHVALHTSLRIVCFDDRCYVHGDSCDRHLQPATCRL